MHNASYSFSEEKRIFAHCTLHICTSWVWVLHILYIFAQLNLGFAHIVHICTSQFEFLHRRVSSKVNLLHQAGCATVAHSPLVWADCMLHFCGQENGEDAKIIGEHFGGATCKGCKGRLTSTSILTSTSMIHPLDTGRPPSAMLLSPTF